MTALAALLLTLSAAQAQSFLRLNVPSSMCAGVRDTITFGTLSTDDIVVTSPTSSRAYTKKVMLPDAVECPEYGCSFQSQVEFNSFPDTAVMHSLNDIKYLRINMEHSRVGDLYIKLTCPSGKKSDIIHYGGSTESECANNIPSMSWGWSDRRGVANMDKGTYMGIPINRSNTAQPCSPSARDNEPGKGWNYCWSNNTNSGYRYVRARSHDDGILYREGHAHRIDPNRVGNSIDASNVLEYSNFYHPEESFNALKGCPLNGNWTLEIVDGTSGNNGYVFEWELALDPVRLPSGICEADSFRVEGPGQQRLNGNTFVLIPPYVTDDSMVFYHFKVYSACGVTDTTIRVTVHPSPVDSTSITSCDKYLYRGTYYYADTVLRSYSTTSLGCLRTTKTIININYHHDTTIHATTDLNALPYRIGNLELDHSVDSLITMTTVEGCDSNVLLHLYVKPIFIYPTVAAICEHDLPFTWQGNDYYTTTTDTIKYELNGVEYQLVLNLTVHPDSDTIIVREDVRGPDLPFVYDGNSYYNDYDGYFHFQSRSGCDSVVHLILNVHKDSTYVFVKDVCDDALPCEFMGYTFTETETVTNSLVDSYGMDSIVKIIVTVRANTEETLQVTSCDNTPYQFGDRMLNVSGLYTDELKSIYGCDSIVHLDLSVYSHFDSIIYDTACFNVGFHYADSVYRESGDYDFHYLNQWGCDSLLTIKLTIQGEKLEACIHAVPMVVTPNDPDVMLYACSRHAAWNEWHIGDYEVEETRMKYTFPMDSDQVSITLVAFSPEGCSDTTSVTIDMDRTILLVPNAFTPSQNNNAVWAPQSHDIVTMEVWIYNRHGGLVSHLELGQGWDGRNLNGEPCPQGVYSYRLEYRPRITPERLMATNGTILLLR